MPLNTLECDFGEGYDEEISCGSLHGLSTSLGEKLQVTVHKAVMKHMASPNYLV